MSTRRNFLSASLCLAALCLPVQEKALPAADNATAAPHAYPQFSGIYPHLAALANSYTEAGIGAVVPWANRLWYVSYVAHRSGARVGLYEITPELSIRRRPESIVGTHAGRMIHRESNQLIIGPYVIDAAGKVRVLDHLASSERVTAIARHLKDPACKVYVQAMEGKYYEVDVNTLETTLLGDARKELGIRGAAHLKGAYTAQGRYVVANNSYDAGDARRSSGDGRLAEWDGKNWTVIHRTAFCDVTTAAGVHAAADDNCPLYSIGWDKRSVLLAVLSEGRWTTYRLPKGSQAYDHAWCTEWPRIRRIGPGQLMLDMHGLFYRMSPKFGAGDTGGLAPLAYHLRMAPDFCDWRGKLVLAGDQNSSMGHRHRTGGQPQSNLWFGSPEELRRWGRPAGWGGPWLEDRIRAGVPSEPFLIKGFTRRVLHLVQGASPAGMPRCSGAFEVVDLPNVLAKLDYVTIRRGCMEQPAPGYSFQVNQDVVVYLAVHQRGNPEIARSWEETDMKIRWTHGRSYFDSVYKRTFKKGRVEIPGHNGHNELKHYGVPHMCFVADAAPGAADLVISGLPEDLTGETGRRGAVESAGSTRFTLEVDEAGTGSWSAYKTIEVPADGYAYHILPDELSGCWMRITPDRDTVASAQFMFGPRQGRENTGERAGLFRSLPLAAETQPRVEGGLLPFADRLWFAAYRTDAAGRAGEGLGLYEIDQEMKFVKRPESIPGVFANRKMIGGLLSIGPHLISADGRVRTIKALEAEHVVSSIRSLGRPEKMYLLSLDGRLLQADLKTLELERLADIPQELGLAGTELRFKAGHQAGGRIFVTAAAPDGRSGCLAEWDGKAWKMIDRRAFGEVTDWASMSQTVVATGWDRASAILKIRSGQQWITYRLPKADPSYDTAWQTAWPRIREVETERILMDVHGIFYETTGLSHAWFVRPIATHGRLVSDFCSWRGTLVMAGNDARARPGSNYVCGGRGVGLWFGKTDDLWQFGKPRGEGGPWLQTAVRAGQASEPYLMTNFQSKRVELSHDADRPVEFGILVDPLGTRQTWNTYRKIDVPVGRKVTHRFPDGFSAHWVRVEADRDCRATAWFVYD